MKKTVVFVLLALFTASGAFADNSNMILGGWKLMKHDTEFQDGSSPRRLFAQNPPGYLVFTPAGRMMGVLEAEGRQTGKD